MQISNSHEEKINHIYNKVLQMQYTAVACLLLNICVLVNDILTFQKGGQGFSISLVLMLLSMLLAYSYITDIAVEMVRYPK